MNRNTDLDFSRQLSITIKEETVSRRVVLRNALTFGCGVLLPVVLVGCDSKQSDNSNKSSPAAPAAAPKAGAKAPAASTASGTGTNTPTTPAASATPGKVSQASVQYQDHPKGEQKCSNCALFIEPNACMVVEGVISPDAWTILWAPIAS